MSLKAILFDMDGTLFDTERVYRKAWLHVGIPEEVYFRMIGQSHGAIQELIRQNTDLDPEETYRRKNEYTEALLEEGIPKKPGFEEALRALKDRGYLCAIVTSSSMDRAQHYLEETGSATFFDAVISGQEVEHGKPAPDVFLLGAARLGLQPEECMVVEDSFHGVMAGHAAGMPTVMIPDLRQPDQEIRDMTTAVLRTLHELPGLVEGMR